MYANYSRSFKGWALQAGLRAENTNAKGINDGYRLGTDRYAVYDSTFNRHYTDLFPSAAITFNKNPAKQWTVTYSRRIDRPRASLVSNLTHASRTLPAKVGSPSTRQAVGPTETS